MFKKNNRIYSWLFPNLIKGKTLFSPCFRIKLLLKTDSSKISVIIPKKIIKKRVHRNSLKRKIIHYVKNQYDLSQNKTIGIWVTKGITKPENNWQQEMDKLLSTLQKK